MAARIPPALPRNSRDAIAPLFDAMLATHRSASSCTRRAALAPPPDSALRSGSDRAVTGATGVGDSAVRTGVFGAPVCAGVGAGVVRTGDCGLPGADAARAGDGGLAGVGAGVGVVTGDGVGSATTSVSPAVIEVATGRVGCALTAGVSTG
ncbi:MAG: hypothetical protein U5K74_08385 [Gemmatimonadaceae bacterium]|nr:hypothetical protein [Gemmatimonadaceae bacterium]